MKLRMQLSIAIVMLATISALAGCGTTQDISISNSVIRVKNHSSNSTSRSTVTSSEASKTSTQLLSPTFTSIHMISTKMGWATGRDTLWHTRDGGVSWTQVTPKGLNKLSNFQMVIYGIGNHNAWVAAYRSSSTAFSLWIYHTSDAGQSWVRQDIHDVGQPMSLHFRNSKHGWIALMQGGEMMHEGESVYQTNNGGKTWSRVSVTNDVKGGTLPFAGDKTGVSFTNDNRAWATGYTPANGHVYLYKTEDDGKRWVSQTPPIPKSVTGQQFISYPPMFFGRHDGILAVSSYTGLFVYRTTDDGRKWLPGKVVRSTIKNQTIRTWSFPTMKDGFVANGNSIFRTTDSGQTWSSFTPNIPFQNVKQIDFVSPTTGWALMTTGSLYHTADGGHAWKQIS